MKKITFLIVMLVNIVTYSQTFTYNGINYSKISSNTLKVDVNSTTLSGEITIPDTLSYNDTICVVKQIGQYAFANCTEITKINLPITLELIDTGAFMRTIFDSINIPDSVSKIGLASFDGNTILKYVKLPFNLLTIEQITFNNCEMLHTVIFNPNLVKIENVAFSCCYALDSVDLPESVTTIEDSAFFNCGLNIVFFAPQRINNFAFGDCFRLNQIYSKTEIPPTIAENTFQGIANDAKVFVCGDIVDYKNTTWGIVFDTIKNAPISLCNLELYNVENNIDINIYPNPSTNGIINVHYINNSKELNKMYLYDSKGTLINSILFRENTKINITTSGIYYLKIGNIVKKIIKI